MLPSSFTVMDALPLSPTGKIDRAALPLPRGAEPRPAASPAAGGNETESLLLDIWRQILGTQAVGLDDNFFDLGGTSLQIIAVHARITAAMKCDISVVDLFQFPSIGALAARLRRDTRASPPASTAGGAMHADERARRQQSALARARANSRRNA
jgi:acyl carrier protein